MKILFLAIMISLAAVAAQAAEYRLQTSSPHGNVIRESDGATIPARPSVAAKGKPGRPGYVPGHGGNADYDSYLAWVAAGNKPDPALNPQSH
jgi:hypothetical protein